MNAKAIAAWVVGSGVGLTILGLAFKMLVSMEVAGQLSEAGIVPVSTVTALETRIDGLETIHGTDIIRVESKAERIAQILMED